MSASATSGWAARSASAASSVPEACAERGTQAAIRNSSLIDPTTHDAGQSGYGRRGPPSRFLKVVLPGGDRDEWQETDDLHEPARMGWQVRAQPEPPAVG